MLDYLAHIVGKYGGSLIEIDGSYGEGGGQILRTALAFSAILKKALRVHHIRAKRKNPGIQTQHLTGVESLAKITDAHIEGARIGSGTITFIPQNINPGDYQFEIKTAGSVTLLLQTLFLPLCLCRGNSRLTLKGGTHVPWSPPFHYFSEVLLPVLESIGVSAEVAINNWGYYPRGGGEIKLKIRPNGKWNPISLIDRGSLKKIRGLSAISNLPRHVAERQKEQALKRIHEELKVDAEISTLYDAPSSGAGSFLFLLIEYEKILAGFSSLGSKGKPAERVADEAVNSMRDHIQSDGCIDPHLADQLVPFLIFAKGNSVISTSRITEHLLTNLWIIKQFFDVGISISGKKGKEGKVEFFNE